MPFDLEVVFALVLALGLDLDFLVLVTKEEDEDEDDDVADSVSGEDDENLLSGTAGRTLDSEAAWNPAKGSSSIKGGPGSLLR